tara:strand:- start:39 stop:185 length:147 start_codon:yes stop_codon:yes gene_type:complete
MYSAREIDRMTIEELEGLTYSLTEEQKTEWVGCGYDGASYVRITNVNL